jgi:fructose-bisphosphate aldolase class II
VLHGSSGVPHDTLKEAVKRGVRKINIDTNIREASWLQSKPDLKPSQRDRPAQSAETRARTATEIIREKIRVFGSSGKANTCIKFPI